jgi:hypothetical protein
MEEKKDDFIEIKASDYQEKKSSPGGGFCYVDLNKRAQGACCQGNTMIWLGGLALFLGVFRFGQEFQWWNFSLNTDIFWPIFLIILGLFIIFKQKIPRSLLWVFLFFASLVLILSLLATSNLKDKEEDNGHHFFFGDYTRPEAEERIEKILDKVYEEDEKKNIGVIIEEI